MRIAINFQHACSSFVRRHGLNAALIASTAVALVTTGRNLLLVSGSLGGNPSLECRDSVHSVGRVGSTNPIEHSFVLFNVGGRDLVISGIASDCRCTRTLPTLFPQTVPPGESIQVVARMDPQHLKGFVRKRMFVFSNDLRNPRQQLMIEAEIFDPTESRSCGYLRERSSEKISAQ